MSSDPIEQLRSWIDEARAAGSPAASAMCLATVGADGAPSARIVLLRGLDARGLRFYTSYFSRKGMEIEANPKVAAVFHWPEIERQVRIEGSVTKLSEAESDQYFASRPRGHQLSAWASEQSEPLDARSTLEERRAHFDERFGVEPIPRPHSWGGYLIAPHAFEFWHGRPNRLHDRLRYDREGAGWRTVSLQP